MFNAKHWFEKFKKYFFYYRDGFYELPYVANSPELTVESFNAMPFVKNYRERGYYETSNLFIKGSGHYHEVEEGLWIIMSDMKIKRNLSFKLHYEPGVPSEYHFLTLYLNKGSVTLKRPKIHLDIDNLDRSWTLFKAGSKAYNTHFQGQESIFFTIYFNDEWMRRNITSNGVLKNPMLEQFFKSDQECLFLPYFLDEKKTIYKGLVNSILDKDENGLKDKLALKINTLDIISTFVSKLDNDSVEKVALSLPERDKRNMQKAKHILSEAAFQKFPSIEAVAGQVGVSETKLKSDFKKVYGMTLYQYYSYNQMRFAKEMLTKETIPIKEIAFSFGYTNPGKFSAAFKKAHGHLPSQTMV